VLPGEWTFPSERDVTIIDTAAIDLAQRCPVGNENGDFRGNGRVGHCGKALLRIEHSLSMDVELRLMSADHGSGVAGIWIDPPKAHGIGGEFMAEPLDLRDIAIGNWAIRCSEEQHNRS
jgi:hypothetical protein